MMKGVVIGGKTQGISPRWRGGVSLGCLLFTLLVIALGYGGLQFGTAYLKYFEVREQIRDILNWAAAGELKSEEEIKKRVVAKALEVDVELSFQDVQVKRGASTLSIQAAWIHDVEFPYYTLPLRFKVNLTKERRGFRG